MGLEGRQDPYPVLAAAESGFLHRATLEKAISTSSNARPRLEELKLLLTRAAAIRNGCDLDLLVFLHRHPRVLLTNEQIATFVGYDMKQVAQSLEGFIEAGLLERTQNPMHAARMYLLELNGPHSGGFKNLLELACTREGRRAILDTMKSDKSNDEGHGRHLQLMKTACA